MTSSTPVIRFIDNADIDDVLVIGFPRESKKGGKKSLSIHSGDVKLDHQPLIQALEDVGATGAADEVIKLPGTSTKLIVLTGLGETQPRARFAHETLRRGAGAAARSLAGHSAATFALPHTNSEELAAIAEGALLGAYAFDEFRGKSKADRKAPLSKIAIHSTKVSKSESSQILKRASIIAKYTFIVRDLINTPPSHLTPSSFCERFKKTAAGSKVKAAVLDEKQLRKLGYGGIIGVG